MTIALHHCENVTEHALCLEGWQQEFDQLDEGHYVGEIIDLHGDELRLFREHANLTVSQSMHFPEQQWHLVMPLSWPHYGDFRTDSVSIMPRCDLFRSLAPAGYDVLVISLDRERYACLDWDDRQMHLLQVPPAVMRLVKQQWLALTTYLQVSGEEAPDLVHQVVLRQMRDGVAMLLEAQMPVLKRHESCYRTRRYIVDRCHALIRERAQTPPTLMELCRLLRISRRTLQYAFEAETGRQPLHYLRALRLNAVRRQLVAHPEFRIMDAAADQGFFHLSHFSQEYRRLFDELPSATRQRALARAGVSVDNVRS